MSKTYDEALAEFRAEPGCVEQVPNYMLVVLEGSRQIALAPKHTRIKCRVISTDPATIERAMVELLMLGGLTVLTMRDHRLEPLQ